MSSTPSSPPPSPIGSAPPSISLPENASRVLTIPNALSFARLLAGPAVAYLLLWEYHQHALPLFLVAAATDWIDGKVAEYWPSQQSALGSVLDPLADKVLILSAAGALAYLKALPPSLLVLFLFKDLVLVALSLRVRYQLLPQPKRFTSFFKPSVAPVEITPTRISKVNTALQSLLLLLCFLVPLEPQLADNTLLNLLYYVTAGTTIGSLFSYARRLRGPRAARPWRQLGTRSDK